MASADDFFDQIVIFSDLLIDHADFRLAVSGKREVDFFLCCMTDLGRHLALKNPLPFKRYDQNLRHTFWVGPIRNGDLLINIYGDTYESGSFFFKRNDQINPSMKLTMNELHGFVEYVANQFSLVIRQDAPVNPRIDLRVAYHLKDIVKNEGARWDPDARVWFFPPSDTFPESLRMFVVDHGLVKAWHTTGPCHEHREKEQS